MKRRIGYWLALVCIGCLAVGAEEIDWNRARSLYQRQQRGDTLTPDESAYLEQAKAQRRAQQPNMGRQATATGGRTSVGLKPLSEMSAADRYKGEDGGLYGGGRNDPPEALLAAARHETAAICPLDAEGLLSKDGRIVLISIGMSNTTGEFQQFKRLADADPAKAANVVIVDCAQGGMDAGCWAGASTRHRQKDAGSPWDTAMRRLSASGVTPRQVSVVWIKQANAQPSGDQLEDATQLHDYLLQIVQSARQRFPNLRIAYLSSRIYAGYAASRLNPEPYAYEGAFGVRRLILDQIGGKPELNADPARGPVRAPLLLWGPYLWADGTTPRKTDGLIWTRADLAGDGTHPSRDSGCQKVAELLLKFLKTDPLARTWFCKP